MGTRIMRAVTSDVRFPTARSGAGSDAMNRDPDYSAAYVALETDHPEGLTGHGLTFTIGRGTEVCADDVRGERLDRRDADLSAATDRERGVGPLREARAQAA